MCLYGGKGVNKRSFYIIIRELRYTTSMSEIEKNSTKLPQPKANLDGQLDNQEKRKENGRRKFLKGAAAVSPVLLTVANRPVWAANCSLSGELSGNLSHHDNKPCGDEGCSVSYWRQHKDSISEMNRGSWHPSYQPLMSFNEAFGRQVFMNKTLAEIINFKEDIPKSEIFDGMTVNVNSCVNTNLDPTNNDPEYLQKHSPEMMLLKTAREAVAALQNAATSVRYKYTVLGADPDSIRESVILKFQDAWDSSNYERLKELKRDFNTENKRSCPF